MRMKKLALACALALGLQAPSLAQWKPAGDRIKTEWGEKLDPANVLPEYPRPMMERKEWKNLNGLWDYAIRPCGEAEPKTYDGEILVPFAVESSLSGVGVHLEDSQELWYTRQFEVPAGWKGKRVLLHFGAVDWRAHVWVNNTSVGKHEGGYTPFCFDITDALQKGSNKLTVRVWDPTNNGPQPVGKQANRPQGIWYTAVSGIWQTVWLEPVNENHIASMKITPDIDLNRLRIEARTGEGEWKKGCRLEAEVYDNGKLVASGAAIRWGGHRHHHTRRSKAVVARHTFLIYTQSTSETKQHGNGCGGQLCSHEKVLVQARRKRCDENATEQPRPVPVRPAGPGLVARRPLYRPHGRGSDLRHTEDERLRLQHDSQACKSGTRTLVRTL